MTDPKPDVAGARERLVEHLLKLHRGELSAFDASVTAQVAADEIQRQGEEIERLRGALEAELEWNERVADFAADDAREHSERAEEADEAQVMRKFHAHIKRACIIREALSDRARQGGPDHG